MTVPNPIRELETLLAATREADSTLLSMDGYERWGAQHDTEEGRERMMREAQAASEARSTAIASLEALVARLRIEDPEAIARWADLHDVLLREFIEACGTDEGKSTSVFVAKEERDGWAAVKRGERAFVDENTFYVHVDPTRYHALFFGDDQRISR